MHPILLKLFSSFPRRRESRSAWATLLAPVLLVLTSGACVGADTQGPVDDRIACDGGVMECAAYDGCVAGYCDNSCFDHDDCNPGNLCAGYECVSEDAPLDLPPEDLFVEYGETLGEVTWTGCILHADCGSGEMCDAGVCVDADGPIVDWDDPEAEYGLRTRLLLRATPMSVLSKKQPGVACGSWPSLDVDGETTVVIYDSTGSSLRMLAVPYPLEEGCTCKGIERVGSMYVAIIMAENSVFALSISASGEVVDENIIWGTRDDFEYRLGEFFPYLQGGFFVAHSTGAIAWTEALGEDWETYGYTNLEDPVLAPTPNGLVVVSERDAGLEFNSGGTPDWYEHPEGRSGISVFGQSSGGIFAYIGRNSAGQLFIDELSRTTGEWSVSADSFGGIGDGSTAYTTQMSIDGVNLTAFVESTTGKLFFLRLDEVRGRMISEMPLSLISPEPGFGLYGWSLSANANGVPVYESLGVGPENGFLWYRSEVVAR